MCSLTTQDRQAARGVKTPFLAFTDKPSTASSKVHCRSYKVDGGSTGPKPAQAGDVKLARSHPPVLLWRVP